MLCPRRLAPLAPFAALAAALLWSPPAAAYCRSSVCSAGDTGTEHGQVCNPPSPGDCGVVLQWRQPCVSFGVQKSASVQVSWTLTDQIMREAFATWTNVDCGGGQHPSIKVFDFGKVNCDKVQYNQLDGNINVLVFRDFTWPHEGDPSSAGTDTLALTTVTYDTKKGDIFDADIEVNAAKMNGVVVNNFTTSDTDVDVDLLSVLTHEAGHFLGLAHSQDPDATMYPSYMNGSVSLRDLNDDDRAAICAAYPPGRKSEFQCDGLPRHGYSPDCADVQEAQAVKCSLGPGGAAPGAPFVPLLSALSLLAVRRRRRGAPRRAIFRPSPPTRRGRAPKGGMSCPVRHGGTRGGGAPTALPAGRRGRVPPPCD